MKNKQKLLILGKLPPPYMGPSIAFEILINSGLKNVYDLSYLDVKANESLSTLGQFSLKKIFRNLSIYSKLISSLRKNQPDIVLIPISQATIGYLKDSMFLIICFLLRKRVMIQLRGSDFKRWINSASFLTRWYVKLTLKIPEGVIVLGNNLRHLFESYFSGDRIFVVPNGGNYQVPDHVYHSNEVVNIIYLANLQPSKGIEDVIDALVLLQQKIPGKFRMDIIGEWRKPATKEKCLKLIDEYHLPVTFYSSSVSRNKFDYLAKSDIFVFTPREPEGHPWVIVEAMASGLPVISTDQGAIIESVIDKENGFIVPTHAPDVIAEKLHLLITDHGLRERMGRKSREYYLNKFTETKMVQNFSDAFNAVIK